MTRLSPAGLGLVLLLLPQGMGAAAAARETSGANLAMPPLFSGRFVQEKSIAGLRKPLVTKGDFLVARDRGVIWRTLEPFAAGVAVTPKGLWALKEEGGKPRREATHKADLGQVLVLVQQVLSGHPDSLRRHFSVADLEKEGEEAWALELKPLDAAVARFVPTLRLRGGNYVERVEYVEANGDRTRIAFSSVAEGAGALAAWQAAAFP